MADPNTQAEISVALCTFNGERYLEEQLDSIASQTRLPAELVACDDCSSDRTVTLLRSFAARASFPVHIYQNRRQLGSSRNFEQSMRLCRAEYVSLADQDDRWYPSKFARLGDVLDRDQGAGAVFSDAALMNAEGEPLAGSLWKQLRFTAPMQAQFAAAPARILLRHELVTGHTMLIRRSLLAHFRQIADSWQHDGWLTWMSILWTRLRFLPEQLSAYRQHGTQQIGILTSERASRAEADRERHLRDMRRFVDLLSYVEEHPRLAEQWRIPLTRKVAFLKARIDAPSAAIPRLIFVATHAPRYFDLARGWRSLVKDCLASCSS